MTFEPVDPAILNTILTRSADGEGVWDVVAELGLHVQNTMESLKRHHHDAIKAAKKAYKDSKKPKKVKVKP